MAASMPGNPQSTGPSRRSPAAPPPADADLRTWTAYLLSEQSAACAALGSTLYAGILHRAAEDVGGGGPTWPVLRAVTGRDTGAAVGLRLMAAVHRLVLDGRAPSLAAFYPSVGGQVPAGGGAAVWPTFAAVLRERAEEITELVRRPCQTNDVGRAAALLPGFLLVARRTGLPLRLLEIGASAGLNLRWDRFHYRGRPTTGGDERAWGDPRSPVHLEGVWDVPPWVLAQPVEVAQRRGCDPAPVDPATPEGRQGLRASVWADQPQRLARLSAAITLARRVPATVDAEPAGAWLPDQLAEPADGVATVVYHSVVLQYVEPAERAEIQAVIRKALARGSASAPVAWLRMEPEDPRRAMHLQLSVSPSGRDELLARVGAHGDPFHWAGPPAPG